MKTIYSKLSDILAQKSLVERVMFAVACLSALAVIPMLITRVVTAHWLMVSIDSVLMLLYFFVIYAVVSGKYVRFARDSLGVLICAGMIGTTMIGASANAYWLYPGFTAIFFLFRPAVSIVICAGVCVIVFPSLFARFDSVEVMTIYATIMPVVIFIYFFAKELQKRHSELSVQASQDFLTSTGNRRAFNQHLEQSIALMKSENAQSALILFDLDHFKRLNDSFGHGMGDKVLQDISRVVKGSLRANDALYRIGGEEFAVVLVKSSLKDAAMVAEKIQSAIRSEADKSLPKYTVSYGISALREQESMEAWLIRADQALYQSKQNGRDCISQL